MSSSAMADVLVIGAGPAGLSSGYYLQHAGIAYEIVDRADRIGSTWNSLYPSLKLNTAGFVSHMPGQRMPLRYGLLPTGKQYYDYLSEWSRRHPLNVRLSVDVRRVTAVDGGWCVETSEGSNWYPVVVLATGRFSHPTIPPIPGLDSFEGMLIHAHDFADAAAFAGKRVLVVGSGPSGADIAIALTQVTPGNIMLSIHSDMVIARRNPYGINDTIWKILLRPFPAPLCKWLSDRINFQSYPNVESLGLPLAPNRDDRQGTSVPVRGPEFVQAIRCGTIKPVRGLAALQGRCALLDDGSVHEVDAVIMATGYQPALDYLDVDFETDDQGWPLRETERDQGATALRDHAGLFLVGRNYRGLGALYNIRQEARMAADEIATYLKRRNATRREA
ncbi:MAG: NAD(P)/FAD-dependent oxidoreductase [Anaerolineae bacterium]|nr:NAD(P)/FAD-dependent oxidoreductase [Anaerolineae bacterium]